MERVPKKIYDHLMQGYIASLHRESSLESFIITLACTYEDTTVRKLIDEKYVRIKGGK